MTKQSTVLKALIFILLCSFSLQIFAQQDYTPFYEQSTKINNTGMYVLGFWALLNITSGIYGWQKSEGSVRYVHQMNAMWNVVNLSIASYALISNANYDIYSAGSHELWNKHLQTEKLFLTNAGLDVLYMSAGMGLRYMSKRNEKRSQLLKGYGNSLILQGGFLFVFDLVMYAVQHNRSMNFIFPETVQVGFGLYGFSVRFGF